MVAIAQDLEEESSKLPGRSSWPTVGLGCVVDAPDLVEADQAALHV